MSIIKISAIVDSNLGNKGNYTEFTGDVSEFCFNISEEVIFTANKIDTSNIYRSEKLSDIYYDIFLNKVFIDDTYKGIISACLKIPDNLNNAIEFYNNDTKLQETIINAINLFINNLNNNLQTNPNVEYPINCVSYYNGTAWFVKINEDYKIDKFKYFNITKDNIDEIVIL